MMDVAERMEETVALLHGSQTHELMKRARELSADADAEPGLQRRAQKLLDTWRAEMVRAAQSGEDAPTFLTEADEAAATPEERRLEEAANEKFIACGERFRRVLEKLAANDEKDRKR